MILFFSLSITILQSYIKTARFLHRQDKEKFCFRAKLAKKCHKTHPHNIKIIHTNSKKHPPASHFPPFPCLFLKNPNRNATFFCLFSRKNEIFWRNICTIQKNFLPLHRFSRETPHERGWEQLSNTSRERPEEVRVFQFPQQKPLGA